jgi:hypothetical protein
LLLQTPLWRFASRFFFEKNNSTHLLLNSTFFLQRFFFEKVLGLRCVRDCKANDKIKMCGPQVAPAQLACALACRDHDHDHDHEDALLARSQSRRRRRRRAAH